MKRNRYPFMDQADGGDGGAGGGAAAPVADAPAAVATEAPAEGSLLTGVSAPAAVAPGEPNPNDWMPEKFQVKDADGKVDEAASARKLAESYKALEAHKGPMPQAPATADDYVIEPPKGADGKPIEGIDVAGFTADPMFKEFAAKAHAAGMSNAQMQLSVETYLALAPQLVAANMALSLADAQAELRTIWTDDATMASNLSGVVKAINGFGGEADDAPGSRSRLMEKYGRDPDFLAFAAKVSQEMKEDRPTGTGVDASEMDAQAAQKSKAYWDANDPDHARVKAKVDEYYARKFGTSKR